MSIVDIFIIQRAITLYKSMKMQITHKKHFLAVLGACLWNRPYLFTKKDNNFLISALKSSEKGGRGNISII